MGMDDCNKRREGKKDCTVKFLRPLSPEPPSIVYSFFFFFGF